MRGQAYLVAVVRGMFAWAADLDRGGLMPEGFRNPFVTRNQRHAARQIDLLGEPDITTGIPPTSIVRKGFSAYGERCRCRWA